MRFLSVVIESTDTTELNLPHYVTYCKLRVKGNIERSREGEKVGGVLVSCQRDCGGDDDDKAGENSRQVLTGLCL